MTLISRCNKDSLRAQIPHVERQLILPVQAIVPLVPNFNKSKNKEIKVLAVLSGVLSVLSDFENEDNDNNNNNNHCEMNEQFLLEFPL